MGRRRASLIVVGVIAVGLMLAPFVFRMFDRAPQGADMIDEFRPYMTAAQIELFEGHLDTIRAAYAEVVGDMSDVLGPDEIESIGTVATFVEQWPTIDADMTDLVATMDDNRGNYAAVDALPPFDLFPWFFVVPGALLLAAAIWALLAHGRRRTLAVRVVFGLGVALVVAPFVFQMFSRAPQGGDMVSDFEALMTRERVQDVQGYFVVLGAAEGQLRTVALPAAMEASDTATFPATERFVSDWQGIFTDFAPTIGTMSDNVENFAAVAALPPFDLFPWFFLIPGVLVAALAVVAGAFARSTHAGNEQGQTSSEPPEDEAVASATVDTRSPERRP